MALFRCGSAAVDLMSTLIPPGKAYYFGASTNPVVTLPYTTPSSSKQALLINVDGYSTLTRDQMVQSFCFGLKSDGTLEAITSSQSMDVSAYVFVFFCTSSTQGYTHTLSLS